MAMITYPLNDIDYSAEDAGLFHCTRNSGIWAEDSFPISATGTNNSVTVGSGVAWISNDKYWGKVVAQKEEVTLDLGIADPAYNRIDAVVIQFNSNNNATAIVVKKGTPATRPPVPEIVQTEAIFELCLCTVLRPAGSSVVTFANITDTRLNPAICGLMADSVTKIDTSAINAQVQALILSLTEEVEGVRNNTQVLLKNGLYPVGALFMTKTPNNPAEYLGGVWKVYDKNLAYKIFRAEDDFFVPTSSTRSWSGFVSIEGHQATIKIEIVSNVDAGESDVTWGTFDFKKLGFGSLFFDFMPIMCISDSADVLLTGSLGYTTGKFKTFEVIPKKDGNILPSNERFTATFTVPISTAAMYDDACDKFYWERIE